MSLVRYLRVANRRLNPVRGLRGTLFSTGRTLGYDSYLSHVPDRFAVQNRSKYLAAGGRFGPELIERYNSGNSFNNSGDLTRFFFLSLVCDQIVKEGLQGNTAELGVYKGNTAIFVSRLATMTAGKAYLFDTFEGFPQEDLRGIDKHRLVEFGDTSMEAVQSLVDCKSAVYVRGYFPASITGMVPDDAILHVVVDGILTLSYLSLLRK